MAGPASTTPYAEALAAVAALAGPPAWLHAVTSPERVTEALRRQLAPVGVTVEGARTERVRVKGGRWTVRCLATLGGGDDALATVALTGTVSPPGGAAAAPETAAAGVLPDHPPGTARPGLVPGTRLRLPDLGLDLAVVEPEAPDPELPVVPDLLDHGRAAVLLARALGARAPARLEVLEAWVLRQKLGSRCTVGYRIGPVCDGVPDRVVAKAYADDTGERCYAAMTALTVARHGFLAEPLGYLPEERVRLQGWVDGDTTLKELLQRSLSAGDPTVAVAAETGLVRTGRALSHLHRGVASYAPARPYAAALARVRAELAEASATAPELAAGLGPVLDALAEVDLRHPPGAPVPSHGSFRPAQVLVGGSGVTVIDLDAAGLAEPGAPARRPGLDVPRRLRPGGPADAGADAAVAGPGAGHLGAARVDARPARRRGLPQRAAAAPPGAQLGGAGLRRRTPPGRRAARVRPGPRRGCPRRCAPRREPRPRRGSG